MSLRPPVALGIRLALGATGHGRWRSSLLAVASLIGTVLLLLVLAFSGAARPAAEGAWTSETGGPGPLALGAVVLSVLLPVAVLSATAGRLSSALRERRLAGLRLLGMTPGEVRLTAAVEAGVVTFAGWLAGVAVFYALAPVLPRVPLAGRTYTWAQLAPGPGAHLLVLATVPVLVVVLALARRRSGETVLRTARSADARRPGWWRLAPVVLGVVLCLYARSSGPVDPRGYAMLAGIALLGLGMLLLLPVFVRLVADLLLRVSRPSATVAARRLQSQPVAMTRVLSALLIGLFVVTGARAVAVAFEEVPQYANPHHHATVEANARVDAVGADPQVLREKVLAMDGVRDAVPVTRVVLNCTEDQGMRFCEDSAIVASCEGLQRLAPEMTSCPATMVKVREQGATAYESLSAGPVDVHADLGEEWSPALLTLPHPEETLEVSRVAHDVLGAEQLIPDSLLGAAELAEDGATEFVVLADPAQDLPDRLMAAGFELSGWWDFKEYRSTGRMLDLLRLLGAVVLGVGLLSFGVTALDRAVERRREVIGLQLVGVPGRVLRRSQWLETGAPLAGGCLLALGLGRFAGDTYLGLADYTSAGIPAGFFWPLLAAAVAGSLLVGAVTSLAANPQIRPELIRTE